MGYRVDYDALDGLYNQIAAQCSAWQTSLETLAGSVSKLSDSSNIAGSGADSIRTYFSSVHQAIIGTLSKLISLHQTNCYLYKADYQQNVDTGLHSLILSNEIAEIRDEYRTQKNNAIDIDTQLRQSLGKVRDIFQVNCRGISWVADAHERMNGYLNNLDELILSLEQGHSTKDFIQTEEMIQSLQTFLTERRSVSRTFMSTFDMSALASSASFAALYQAYLNVEGELVGKSEAIRIASENEIERQNLLQAEIEERQKKATTVKWIVTGVCIVGSIAAIAVTGGAAAPLVVGAVSGAVMAGTNNLADQYVEHGNLIENSSKIDWASFGKDAVIGGVTGLVTAYIGAGVSQAVTTGLGSTAVGSTLLNSSNAFVRVGTGAVIGATSQVSSGIATRSVSTLITTGGDVDAALEQAFDLKNIAFDAAFGSVSGGVRAAKNPPIGKEIHADELSKDVMESKPMNSPDPEKWLENGGKIYVDGNGTWTYEAPDGVHVCYSDGYPDFKRAGLVEKEVDIGEFDTESGYRNNDFRKAEQISPKSSNTTWHHSEDGHTLQAVDSYYHKLFTHRGGFSIVRNGG